MQLETNLLLLFSLDGYLIGISLVVGECEPMLATRHDACQQVATYLKQIQRMR
jgi:hypothetical protein